MTLGRPWLGYPLRENSTERLPISVRRAEQLFRSNLENCRETGEEWIDSCKEDCDVGGARAQVREVRDEESPDVEQGPQRVGEREATFRMDPGTRNITEGGRTNRALGVPPSSRS